MIGSAIACGWTPTGTASLIFRHFGSPVAAESQWPNKYSELLSQKGPPQPSPAQPSLSKQWTGRANQPPAYLDMNRLQNAQDFRKVTDHFPGNYGIRFYLIKRKKNRKITTSYNQHSWTWKHYDFAWLCSRVSTGPKRKNYRIWSYLSFIQHKFLTASSPPAL